MENSDLMARATVRMKKLLAEPEIQGDQKKALHAACAITENIIDLVGKGLASLLQPQEVTPEPPKKKGAGRPKAKGNPVRFRVTEVAYIAAILAKERGITNNREAAEYFLLAHLGVKPGKRLVENLQKRISETKSKKHI